VDPGEAWILSLELTFEFLLSSQFFNMATFHVIASTQSTAGIIAIALLVPMVCEQFDLSVGANANLTGMLAVILQVNAHWSALAAVLAAIGVGFAVGIVNGFIVVALRVSSFIATLGVSSILGAITIIFTNNITPSAPTSSGWTNLTQTQVGGFQVVFVYLIALALLTWWVLEFTPAGRYLYAIGGNREAARLAGVRVNRWSFLALALAGGVSGFAGILYTSLTGPSFTFGAALLLPGFAAVFLGATQITPGRFNVWGTLTAIFVLAIGVSFESNAQLATVYATRILNGVKPSTLKVGIVSPPDIAISFRKARQIGLSRFIEYYQ